MLLRRVIIVPFGVAAALLLGGGSALAAGPPVVNETDHPVNQTQSFPNTDPCTGAPGTLTITFSGVEHITLFADGTAHFTDTERGTFQFVSAEGTSTGTFVIWDGGNGQFDANGNLIGRGEVAFTLNGRGTRPDGSAFRFHNNAHVVTDAAGIPKVFFMKAQCN
jgi:hypothetical protein